MICLLKHRLLGLALNLRKKPPTAIHVDSTDLKRPLPTCQPPLLHTVHCMEHKHGPPRANTLKALESYRQRRLRKNLEFRWTDHVVRMPDSRSPTQVFSTTCRPKGTGRSEKEVQGSVWRGSLLGCKERRDPTKKAHPPPTISMHPSPHCKIVVLRLASLSMSKSTERTPQDDKIH